MSERWYIILADTVSGCGAPEAERERVPKAAARRKESVMAKKALVAYFSCTGTTERAAKALAEAVGAKVYKIEPAEPYTAADLDWTDKKSRSTLEMKDESCRPAIAGRCADVEESDVIFLGFPVWWYTAPRIVETFLESYDFSSKTVVPFATSGGSGLGQTAAAMRKVCPSAVVAEGRMLNGRQDGSALRAWAEGFMR